jgi:hypothetical protein
MTAELMNIVISASTMVVLLTAAVAALVQPAPDVWLSADKTPRS